MCDPEAFGALADWISLTHEYGEATWASMQWWISGSFAIILTSHFARNSLNIVTTILLGTLYVLFSASLWGNLALDVVKAQDAFRDIAQFASDQGCQELSHLPPYYSPVPVLAQLMPYFLGLMLCSTLGYLGYSYRLNRKSSGASSDV